MKNKELMKHQEELHLFLRTMSEKIDAAYVLLILVTELSMVLHLLNEEMIIDILDDVKKQTLKLKNLKE